MNEKVFKEKILLLRKKISVWEEKIQLAKKSGKKSKARRINKNICKLKQQMIKCLDDDNNVSDIQLSP
jgi:hypothetical protein